MSTRIAIFVSGGGSNARVMIDRFQAHPEDGVEVVLLVSNKATAGALTVAAERGVPSLVVKRSEWTAGTELLEALEAYSVDFIVLAGFLWLIPAYLVQAYPNRIVNIHPALLPQYGGKGMYGHHVHAAVKAAGETESGITIHYVNENYDEGNIIYQAAVRLDADDTPEKIAERVLRLEHANYWRVVRQLVQRGLRPQQ
ncbi:phosphoribosylglycinamide formyltransferase-1 [Lewinella marina]|uniref:Phosphoribosylglycinamide formyltransferase n=1 Tax=Neolewinella marina TaxID=438751 RepID=A0A2G0CEG1_9BACT|nr:phosphoribosylglycinamide formyltransferase [Neolewinella marina]NJB87329.1 phosphoribosylglycinamide formyltransferase-1 [Neolewinella marina]PHK98352.1 phosphoribosylglycinamide formyltransferase [Neolewinella marina]